MNPSCPSGSRHPSVRSGPGGARGCLRRRRWLHDRRRVGCVLRGRDVQRECRRICSTRASTVGGGWNADRGTARPAEASNVWRHRLAPGAVPPVHRRTAWSWRTRCAVSSRLPGCKRRRSNAVVTSNGGFATTWYGRRGRRRSAASVRTTTMAEPKRSRSTLARPVCASTAITRAPASSSGAVTAPVPAPISMTSAPGAIAASVTSCRAHRGSS